MIREDRDPAFWDRIGNHPAVRPHVGGEGPLTFEALMQRADVIPLAMEHGGFIFIEIWPGRYELHTLFLPEGRGRPVLEAFAEAARWLFTRTHCMEIVTKAPASNRAANFMARRAGFKVAFVRDAAWADGSAVTFYSITLDAWAAMDAAALTEGRAFHDMLETAKAAVDAPAPIHPDDDPHDHAAGAALLMLKAGMLDRAVWFYNRWAAFAGYRDIEIVSAAPPQIDIRDAVIGLRDGELEVVRCQSLR